MDQVAEMGIDQSVTNVLRNIHIKKLRRYKMNNVMFVVEIIAAFASVVLIERSLKAEGVIAWVAMATILANIVTAKSTVILGFDTTLGTALFASVFLATDVLFEKYGKELARKAVYVGLISSAALIVATQISIAYIPSTIDYADGAMRTLFGLNLRISLASIAMYFIANMADIFVFEKIRDKTGEGKLWLRNNVATILCNCLENFGFVSLAFIGIYDIQTVVGIAISTSILEMIAAVCDTPFLYLAKRNNGHIPHKTLGTKESIHPSAG